MTHRLLLVGGGGHATVVAEAARAGHRAGAGAGTGAGPIHPAGVLDDHERPRVCAADEPLERLGTLGDFAAVVTGHDGWILALGDVALRRGVLDAIGTCPVPALRVVHPASVRSGSATIDAGAFIGPGAIVQAGASVGPHAIVNSGAIVEHDCRVGANSHLGPRSTIGGGVTVGRDVLVGLGACVLPGVRVGAGSVIGAGAVVIRDVPEGARVVGVPARSVG